MSGMQHSIAYIKYNSILLPTMPGAKLDLGGRTRASVVGDNKVHGFSEVLKPSMLECEISLGAGLSLAQLQNITGATVTYEADTGQTYIIKDAFVVDPLTVTAGEGGKVTLKFEGQPATEVVGS